jgi:hypothetical protein
LAGAGDLQAIPAMRPRLSMAAPRDPNKGRRRPTAPVQAPPPGSRDVKELADAARSADVSPDLKTQLTQLAGTAESKSVQPAQAADIKSARDALETSVGLLDAMTASDVPAEDRKQIESQLADSLALIQDARTRSAGQSRLEQLSAYHQTLMRFARIGLDENERKAVAPALAFARAHRQAAGELIRVLDRFVTMTNHYDNRARPPEELPPQFKRPADDLQHQFADGRAVFLKSISELSEDDTANAIKALDAQVDDLAKLTDVLDAVEAAPRTISVLNAFKPKPFGALERRMTVAADAAASSSKSPARVDAIRLMLDLRTTSLAADALDLKASDEKVPAEVINKYTGTALSGFELKWRTMVGDLASQAASNGTTDRSKVDRLLKARDLVDSLRDDAEVESALAKAPMLQRWVDWSMTPNQLDSALAPYRQASADAFVGFASGDDGAIERWSRQRQRVTPLQTLLKRDDDFADGCAALPTGLTGEAARLITPIAGQPYTTERDTSAALDFWSHATDPAMVDAIFDDLNRRLRGQMRLNAPQ